MHRIVAATDPGQVVNPQQIEAQVEGSFAYGLSAALFGECTLKDRVRDLPLKNHSLKRARASVKLAALAFCWIALSAQAQGVASIPVIGDSAPVRLTNEAGDPARGRAIVANRQLGLCLLCHSGPIPEERFQGNLAPDLAGAGARWSEAQLRLRLIDARKINPQTIMPSYYRTDGLARVGTAWQGKPIFNPQQVEDVVAYLVGLR